MSSATQRRGTPWLLGTMSLFLFCSASAYAHKVNIFATVQDGVIHGECYFSSGARPEGCLVEFLDTSGRKLGHSKTDAEGRFTFKPRPGTDCRIVLDAGDGHRAEFAIQAVELASGLPVGAATAPGFPEAADKGAAPMLSDIEQRISEAVAREILPLRRQMDRMENRVRFRDVLGGIGYIFGLAGVALYFKSRRRGSG